MFEKHYLYILLCIIFGAVRLFAIPETTKSSSDISLFTTALKSLGIFEEVNKEAITKDISKFSSLPEIKKLKEASLSKTSNTSDDLNKAFAKQADKFKQSVKTCSINIIEKNYNDYSQKHYFFDNQEFIAKDILLDNYDFFGYKAWLHLPQKNSFDLKDADISSSICDLRIFKGDSEPNHNLVNALIKNCKTDIGKVVFKIMALRPTTDTKLLKNRQNIINAFIKDSKLLASVESALDTLKNYESDFLYFRSIEKGSLLANPWKKYFYASFPLPLPPSFEYLCRTVSGKDLKPKFLKDIESMMDTEPLLLSYCPLKFWLEKIIHLLADYNYCKKTACEDIPQVLTSIKSFSLDNIEPLKQELWEVSFKDYVNGLGNSANRIFSLAKLKTYREIFSFKTLKNPLGSLKQSFYFIDDIFKPITVEPKLLKLFCILRYLYYGPQHLYQESKDFVTGAPDVFFNCHRKLIGTSKFFQALEELQLMCAINLTKQPKLLKELEIVSHCSQNSINSYKEAEKRSLSKLKKELLAAKKEKKILLANRSAQQQCSLSEINEKIYDLTQKIEEVSESLASNTSLSLNALLKSLKNKVFDLSTKKLYSEISSGNIFPIGEISVAYKQMHRHFKYFTLAYQAIGEIDAYAALARTILDHRNNESNKYCLVNFEQATQPHIYLNQVWNPLAATISCNDGAEENLQPTPNSIELGFTSKPININYTKHMILTGPNASGKSTFMRSISYAIWLAQTFGIAPAASMSLTPFHFLYSLKKDNENTAQGLSTHKAQVVLVKRVLDKLEAFSKENKLCFVACDEIFNGTNANDATANTVTVAEEINNTLPNTIAIISSHANGVAYCEKITNNGFRCFKITNAPERKLELGCSDVKDPALSTNILLMDEAGYSKDFLGRVSKYKQVLTTTS